MREVFKPLESSLSDDEVDARFAYYSKIYGENWLLFPDALRCLEALGDRPLGVITNGAVQRQNQKLRNLQIREWFKVVVISEEVGASKPDSRIVWEACRLAGVRPQDSVYVGDRLETDARGSSAIGMRGVWLDRNGDRDNAPSLDVDVINSLSELPRLLWGNTIAFTPEEAPVHEWQKRELERRKAGFSKRPESGSSWNEVKQRVRKQCGFDDDDHKR